MTIDTAALRALADYAEKAYNPARLAPDTVRALCDGYDEAQRLRALVTALSNYMDKPWSSHDWWSEVRDAFLAAGGVFTPEHFTDPYRLGGDAARQALDALVDDLRALCDEWDAGGDDWTPVLVRTVIDRHAPEGDA